jgi:hypothetical protein
VSQYNTFKNQIENKAYEVLSLGLTIASVEYTERKLANTVWNLIESYGFGSVERNLQKINWYDTEERKELMANIVLNNKGYAERLGYGNTTGNMDYLFAARLAVLTFVDWVDRTYVDNTWISSLAAAFGVNIRLAELVNQVFGISGFVLSSIRDELNKAWEGIKSVTGYITDIIFDAIMESVVLIMKSLLQSMTILFASIFDINYSIEENGVSVGGNLLEIQYSNRDLTIKMGNHVFKLVDMLREGFSFQYETLSVIDTVMTVIGDVPIWVTQFLHIMLRLATLGIAVASPPNLLDLSKIIPFYLIFGGTTSFLTKAKISNLESEGKHAEKADYLNQLKSFHWSAFLGSFIAIILESAKGLITFVANKFLRGINQLPGQLMSKAEMTKKVEEMFLFFEFIRNAYEIFSMFADYDENSIIDNVIRIMGPMEWFVLTFSDIGGETLDMKILNLEAINMVYHFVYYQFLKFL